MPSRAGFVSVFDQAFDVAVFGAGYAGLAACRLLTAQGLSVLLVDRGGDAAWESGRAMSGLSGSSPHPQWQSWLAWLRQHQIADGKWIDAAPAEVMASQAIARMPGLRTLYYASPIALEPHNHQLSSVILATKAGLRRIAARRYLDCTEIGQLLGLLPDAPRGRQPVTKRVSIYFQHLRWTDDQHCPIRCAALPGASLHWSTTRWPRERCLRIDLPGDDHHPRGAWLPAIEAARMQLGDLLHQAVLSHGSVIPLPIYEAGDPAPALRLPDNVASAVPSLARGSFETLAERYELGAAGAAELLTQSACEPLSHWRHRPIAPLTSRQDIQAAIAIAGLGTGGLLAAVAAGRRCQNVVAFDPLPFAGGIGTGGGIHLYYHGVKGGLQDELDQRIRQVMPLFGGIAQVRGFHPDAKKIVADAMLREAGVRVVDGFLTGLETHGPQVTQAILSTPQGPASLRADCWIDSTGDGDLAALAGAHYSLGRQADGQLHAYSQSSGRVTPSKGAMLMFCLNYDAGHVDPTDPEDLTRGRLLGIGHYQQDRYSDEDRPTYIAPAIGLRQARHIETDYVLTLADLIERRRFRDCVGYTSAHYDNHASDYQQESDQAMFWVWVCRQWHAVTACEIPYRSLLPRGLSNVWMACRALGVSLEAHHSMRMQRDIQRIGEVAGLAAALAVRDGVDSRAIDFNTLAASLRASGAIHLTENEEDPFGHAMGASGFTRTIDLTNAASLQAWACAIRENQSPQAELWHLHRAGPKLAGRFIEPLLDDSHPDVSWHAAAIMAMWGDGRAQHRLCEAIRHREYGFENTADKDKPEQSAVLAPRWMQALALLRVCGDAACLATIHSLAADPALVADARTSIAATCHRLAQRCELSGMDQETLRQIASSLLASPPPLTAAPPRRSILARHVSTQAMENGWWVPVVMEDFSWQLHLEVARLRITLGLEPHEEAMALLEDERLIVRRAMHRLLAHAGQNMTATVSVP